MKAFAAILLAASSAFAADPALLGLVMPDAKVVTGIHIAQSQASPFGQYIIAQMKPGADFDKLTAAIGFDPRRDLQELLAATPATDKSDGANPPGLILGRGKFQADRISTAAKLAGATESTYKGFQLYSGTGPKGNNGAIAFLSPDIVAVGDLASVKGAIDRRAAGTVFSGPLADQAREISAADDAWFVSSVPSSFLAGKFPAGGAGGAGFNPAQALQSVAQAGGGAKFSSAGVTLSIEALTRSNQDAQALADVLRFALSFVQMNRNSNPAAGKAAAIADAATFTASGPLMKVSVTVPEQQVEQMFMPAPAPKKVAAR